MNFKSPSAKEFTNKLKEMNQNKFDAYYLKFIHKVTQDKLNNLLEMNSNEVWNHSHKNVEFSVNNFSPTEITANDKNFYQDFSLNFISNSQLISQKIKGYSLQNHDNFNIKEAS